jgi:hypothetical protein
VEAAGAPTSEAHFAVSVTLVGFVAHVLLVTIGPVALKVRRAVPHQLAAESLAWKQVRLSR